jgi:molybdopterin-biosynthesis enzyme MoeA-like protein
MAWLPNQRGELGFSIRRVAMVNDTAEKILRLLRTAVTTGSYPTGEELEGKLAGAMLG